MAKAYEVDMTIEDWGELTGSDHIIAQDSGEGYQPQDYILFHQVDSAKARTGLFQMVQVSGVQQDDGLKEGFILLTYSKL